MPPIMHLVKEIERSFSFFWNQRCIQHRQPQERRAFLPLASDRSLVNGIGNHEAPQERANAREAVVSRVLKTQDGRQLPRLVDMEISHKSLEPHWLHNRLNAMGTLLKSPPRYWPITFLQDLQCTLWRHHALNTQILLVLLTLKQHHAAIEYVHRHPLRPALPTLLATVYPN